MSVTITSSNMPPWKAELLQRKAQKFRIEQKVQVPEWKRQLLQRLHEKSEAARIKMAAEAKKSDEKLVLDEPILKVSDNFFKRKELERKLSSGQAASKRKFNFETGLAGHRVIKTDKMVIIERSKDTKLDIKAASDEVQEVPNAGIVSRMRGRFSSDDEKSPLLKPLENRSKSSDDILNIENDDYPPSPVSPADDYSALNRNVDRMKPLPQDRRNKRYSSMEEILTHDYNSPTPTTITSDCHKANFSVKKNSAPTSPTKQRPLANDTIDMTSLHAPGSPSSPVSNFRFTDKPPLSQARPKLSDRTQEFTKDLGDLHASSVELYPNKAGEINFGAETILLSSAPTISIPTPNDRLKHSESKKPVDGARDVTIFTSKQDSHSKSSHSVFKPNHTETHNKENIPDIPKRRNLPITKAWSNQLKTGGSEASNLENDGGQIIELGRVSMDASMLKSKAAIAANEIMKESRTIMIVPRGRNKNVAPKSSLKTKKEPRTEAVYESKITNGEIQTQNEPKAAIVPEKAVGPDTKLPSSSVDDVIAISSSFQTTPVHHTTKLNSQTKTEVPEIKLVENQAAKEPVVPISKPGPRNFIVNSSSRKVNTSRSTESNAAVTARFGAKLTSSSTSKPNFGGKSFVIDPSKFKKSSAQPPATAAASAKTKESQVQNVGSATRVISPKTQLDSSQTIANEEGSLTPKGKRKLTADQIVVIGGYVKLDHSSLSKPNKLRRGVHVKFEESRLESIFQYPSERSLLNEDQESKLNQRMTSLGSTPGLSKESSLDKYTPKVLLAMKEPLNNMDDDDRNAEKQIEKTPVQPERDEVLTDLATPLADSEAAAFSSSSSSSDLLF